MHAQQGSGLLDVSFADRRRDRLVLTHRLVGSTLYVPGLILAGAPGKERGKHVVHPHQNLVLRGFQYGAVKIHLDIVAWAAQRRSLQALAELARQAPKIGQLGLGSPLGGKGAGRMPHHFVRGAKTYAHCRNIPVATIPTFYPPQFSLVHLCLNAPDCSAASADGILWGCTEGSARPQGLANRAQGP